MNPPVYPVGCAGRITQFSETDDGRYLITLTGVSRFRIREELPLLSGYRRVVPDWQPFARDRDRPGEPGFDRERLLRGLEAISRRARSRPISRRSRRRRASIWSPRWRWPARSRRARSRHCSKPPIPTRGRELLTALVEMAAIEPADEDSGGTRH